MADREMGEQAEVARFGELVRAGSVPIGEAALVAAAALGHPASVAIGLERLQSLADAVPGDDLGAVTQHLFGTVGFRGDDTTYYAAANSLLPDVLDRRKGIPITLAIVAADVARRKDLAATVVGMPGHVLLGDGDPPTQWCDCFNGGQWLDPLGARARYASIHGRHAPFDPRFLRAIPDAAALTRMLGNLVSIYANEGDGHGLVRALLLRSQIPGVADRERRQLAAALTSVGRYQEAADLWDLEAGDAEHEAAEEARTLAAQARANLN